MKKHVSLILLAAMLAATFSGCNSGSTDNGSSSDSTPASTSASESGSETAEGEESSGWTGETEHIIMTYLHAGTIPTDLDKVFAAVNEITVPAIGVEVKPLCLSIGETGQRYSLWISGGEQIDLAMVPFTNLGTYSSQGLILPLDDLLAENAPYITNAIEEEGYPLLDGSYYQGEAYGVTPLMYYYGTGGSYLIDAAKFEEAGLTYNEGDVWTMDQLGEMFGAIKELYPDAYPNGTITSGRTASYAGSWNLVYDPLGATPSSGVLMGTDSTTVENLFATDEYYQYVSYMKEWYDAGYIYPDSATTSSTQNELMRAETTLGYPISNQPVMESDAEAALGKDFVHIMLTESYYTAQSSSGGTFWTVPISAASPETAIRFLDYTFSNHDVHNMILWGLEGEHFEVLDADEYLIGFPEGIDGSNSPYYNTFGLYGDRRYEYIWDIANSKSVNEEYTADAMSRPTKAVGYAYDTTRTSAQIANVDAIVTQYAPTLESGSEGDLDTTYQEFLSALEAAGINDIIADNQAQFDEWLAQQ